MTTVNPLTKNFGHTEEDVKIHVILPLLEKFKIDKSSLEFERKIGTGLADIFFESNKGYRLIIEAKNPNFQITERDFQQLLTYLRNSYAIIGIITNGQHFFLVSLLPLKQKTFEESILGHFTYEELTKVENIEKMKEIISRDALESDNLELRVITWKKQREELRNELEGINETLTKLKEQRQEKIDSLQQQRLLLEKRVLETIREYEQLGQKHNHRRQELHQELGITHIKKSSPKPYVNSTKTENYSDLSLLPEGLKIFLRYKSKQWNAIVTGDRRIMVATGEMYNSLSTAAKRIKESQGSTSPNTNGWTAWHTILQDGSKVPLDYFRNQRSTTIAHS